MQIDHLIREAARLLLQEGDLQSRDLLPVALLRDLLGEVEGGAHVRVGGDQHAVPDLPHRREGPPGIVLEGVVEARGHALPLLAPLARTGDVAFGELMRGLAGRAHRRAPAVEGLGHGRLEGVHGELAGLGVPS